MSSTNFPLFQSAKAILQEIQTIASHSARHGEEAGMNDSDKVVPCFIIEIRCDLVVTGQ